jgi:hypothetical protein
MKLAILELYHDKNKRQRLKYKRIQLDFIRNNTRFAHCAECPETMPIVESTGDLHSTHVRLGV